MLLNSTYHLLTKHPEIGILSGLSVWLIDNIESINYGTDILKFIGTGLGVAIAAITLFLKIIELRKKTKEK